ncbi:MULTISPECIES: hypothetical protein [unclassified Streptomyces]|uniref:hypothetical protein n=1 Tax=unclassified Streptomyces TaxID=2593676 RepID=UPI003431D57C
MVSSSHETLHRIFQEDPGLFVRAVKGVGVTFADPVAAVPFPTDLTAADDESTASKFIELTEQGLGTTPAANLWRQIMAADLSFFQSQTAQNLRAEGREEGRAVGRAEVVLLLLGDRGVEVSEEARERILGCQDLEILDVWLRRATTAVSVAEVFGDTEG